MVPAMVLGFWSCLCPWGEGVEVGGGGGHVPGGGGGGGNGGGGNGNGGEGRFLLLLGAAFWEN